jgi:hypothetical protein
MIASADSALYQAKAQGWDRVQVFSSRNNHPTLVQTLPDAPPRATDLKSPIISCLEVAAGCFLLKGDASYPRKIKMIRRSHFTAATIVIAICNGCSTREPLETTAIPTSKPAAIVQTDQAVVADRVGNADAGVTPLAWANPSTGSAGVIEQIDDVANGRGCRTFVSTQRTLDAETRFRGLATRTSSSRWKLNSTPQS